VAQTTLSIFQNEMAGEAAKAGLSSEDDVVQYIKGLRAQTEDKK
jgi:hypothetical protein